MMIKRSIAWLIKKLGSPIVTDVKQMLNQVEKNQNRIIKKIYNSSKMLESTQIYIYYSFLFEQSNYGEKNTSENKRERPLVVTMTSIPYRINKVHIAVESIFRQSIRPDYVVLNLDRSTYNENNIPWALKKQESRGLLINYVEDIGPYTKIIPTIKLFPNSVYVTADDDIIYAREWLERLYSAYLSEPEYIHCHRAHFITFGKNKNINNYKSWPHNVKYVEKYKEPSLNVFPTGVGGVIYSYDHFDEELFNNSTFLEMAPKADDVWLKAMSLKNNVKCKLIPGRMEFDKEYGMFNISVIPDTQEGALHHHNLNKDYNDIQIKAVFEKYNLFEILLNDIEQVQRDKQQDDRADESTARGCE